jgi:serine/threonine-protein kinase
MLYEIVAGQPLHRGARTLASALQAEPARPSRVRPDAPPELDALCAQATQADPAARLPKARALGDAIEAFLDGDRDTAVRRELARGHLADAQAAIARGDDEDNRKAAMAAAGRALALDPTATAAADLITSLVLRPPRELPAEVVEKLVRIDIETGRSQGRLAALSMIGYLGFVPLLLWTGVRDNFFILAFVALTAISGLQVYSMTRGDEMPVWRIYLSAILNATLIGLICRMVGPFIVAPTLVATTLTAYAAHPRFGRISIIATILAASVAVPWVLELAGVLSPTYSFENGTLVLHSSVLTFQSAPVQLAFAALLITLLAVVALLTRTNARRQRAAARQVELQAWHLRQLVPSGSAR